MSDYEKFELDLPVPGTDYKIVSVTKASDIPIVSVEIQNLVSEEVAGYRLDLGKRRFIDYPFPFDQDKFFTHELNFRIAQAGHTDPVRAAAENVNVLRKQGLYAEKFSEDAYFDYAFDLDLPVIYSHLIWMSEQIPSLLEKGKDEKAMRWLGFINGVLWSMGFHTLDDLKKMNR